MINQEGNWEESEIKVQGVEKNLDLTLNEMEATECFEQVRGMI